MMHLYKCLLRTILQYELLILICIALSKCKIQQQFFNHHHALFLILRLFLMLTWQCNGMNGKYGTCFLLFHYFPQLLSSVFFPYRNNLLLEKEHGSMAQVTNRWTTDAFLYAPIPILHIYHTISILLCATFVVFMVGLF